MNPEQINNVEPAERFKAQLAPVFKKYREQLVVIYLFGSQARNSARAGSDIDLAVLLRSGRQSASAIKLQLYAELCRCLQSNAVDLVILNLTKNLILKDRIVRQGVPLYIGDVQAKADFELKVQHRCLDFMAQRRLVMGF